jgi:hypothetical protein
MIERTGWCSQGHEYPDPNGLAARTAPQRCPVCGSETFTFGQVLTATQGQSASVIAQKPPGSSGESVRQQRAGDDPRVSDADLEPSGALSDRIEGRAASKGMNELRTVRVLVEYLNLHGASWSLPHLHEGNREEGFDAWAADAECDQKVLRVQVTTPERSAWKTLAMQPDLARSEPDVEDAVEAIRDAIVKKELFAGIEKIDLTLDATDSSKYAFKGVVDTFLARHGACASGIGYRAIWMVGPTTGLVHRLDAES